MLIFKGVIPIQVVIQVEVNIMAHIPLATSKVWNRHRSAASGNRIFTERGDSHVSGSIVSCNGRLYALFDCLKEGTDYKIVHAAVIILTIVRVVALPQRMLICFFVFLCVVPDLFGLPLEVVVFIIQEDHVVIFKVGSLGSTDSKSPGIASGKRGIQCQDNCLATGAFNRCGNHIALRPFQLGERMIFAMLADNELV